MGADEYWISRRHAPTRKRQQGRLVVDSDSSYYVYGRDQRFHMRKTAKTGGIRSVYEGEKAPWDFDYWMECYERRQRRRR